MPKLGLPFLLIFAFSLAQAAPMGLSQVLKDGLEFSPEVKKSQAALDEATQARKEQESQLYPTVELGVTGKSLRRQIVETNRGLNLNRNSEDYNAAFTLKQPLYTGGALLNGIWQFRTAEDVARQNLFKAKQQATYDLVSAYQNLLEAKRKLAAAEEHQQILKAYTQIVARHERIGRSRKMDRLQSTVNLSLTDANVIKIKTELQKASDQMNRLIGKSEGSEAVDVGPNVAIPKVSEITVAQAFQKALQQNPEVLAGELEVKRQGYENGLNMATDKPQLNIVGAYGYQSNDRPTLFDDLSNFYSVGLELKIPIFSGLSSFSKRRVHAERLHQDERALEALRLTIRQKVEAAVVALENERARLEVAELAARQGREALTLANAGYKQGIVNSTDVFNAQKTRYESEQLVIESQFAFLRSVLELRHIMGVDLANVYAQVH